MNDLFDNDYLENYQNMIKELNQDQIDAVNHFENPCCVIASAGSGKTKTLTLRIANLILNHNIDPSNILAITFTKKASDEMKERLKNLIPNISNLNCSTIHSLCLHICRNYWKDTKNYKQWYTVAQDWQIKKSTKDALNNTRIFGIDKEDIRLKDLINCISLNLNNCVSIKDKNIYKYDNIVLPLKFKQNQFLDFWSNFEAEKSKNKIITFDDMLYDCYEILSTDKNTLKYFQNYYEYILVDEFQDTNHIQNKIISLLAQKHKNIFIVADDKQTIFGFNGSDIGICTGFKNKWNAKLINLKLNYRSTPEILNLANKLIVYNESQEKSTLMTIGIRDSININPIFNTYMDEDEEAEAITKEINNLILEGNNYNDIALIYRTNAQGRALEDSLVKENIPYIVYGNLSFYKRKEIQDILSYLKFSINYNDYESYSRSLKTPTRYCSNVFIDSVADYSSKYNIDLLESTKHLATGRFKGGQNYVKIINTIKKYKSPYDTIEYIRKNCYDEYLKEDDDENSEDNERIENLDTFQASAINFSTIQDFLSHIDLVINSQNNKHNENINSVRLMTIHRAKGLEFKIVFGCGISEGILPHSRSKNKEEERRLAYVLVTRAKNQLFLSSILNYNGNTKDVSLFIKEMGFDLSKYKIKENN